MPSDDYVEVKLLGRGNYGEAWLVKNTKDKKKYVLKRVDLRCAAERERQAAEQEAQLLSQLRHPNIVAYKESFNTDGGFLCIAMGYCEGGDLYRRLQQQNGLPLDERQVVEWFVQISMAIKYMHDRCILHRDLKTQNIFLTKSEIIKVGDLGIARVLESSNAMATTMIGTPYYMSPELFSNKPYDYKSDIWALGCCVYEMMTLKHAFDAKSFNALAFRILQGKLPPMPAIYPNGLLNLVKAMLKKNPEKRPTIERILGDPYIKRHISLFLEKTKTKQPFVNKSRRPAKAAVGVSSESEQPSHPKLKTKISPLSSVSKEKVSQSLDTLHLGPDLARIDEESMSLHGSVDEVVRGKDSRNKVGGGGAVTETVKDHSEDRERNGAKKTDSERQAVRSDSPKLTAFDVPSNKNMAKRDKYRRKRMVEISRASKESQKSIEARLPPEEADKISPERRTKTVSDVGAKKSTGGVKLFSVQGAKAASEIDRNIGGSAVADVVESVQFVGSNVLYRKEVQPNQYITPDENKIDSTTSDSNFNELRVIPGDTGSSDDKKSGVSRKKSTDSVVLGKGEAVSQVRDNIHDKGSPNRKLRNRHVRNLSGDSNNRSSPIFLESVANNTRDIVDNNRAKQVEDGFKENGSPKPKSKDRPARKSGDNSNAQVGLVLESDLINSGKVGSKTQQKVEEVGSDLQENGVPRPKSRSRHSRKSSGDSNVKDFPIVRKSPIDSGEKSEGVEMKPSKSNMSEGVADESSSGDANRNAKQRVRVGRPLPPLPKMAAEPKETQFHRKPQSLLTAAARSTGESTPASSSSTSSANSSKDEMNDLPGSMKRSSRERRRQQKQKEGGSYGARSIDLASSEDVRRISDPSIDSVDAYIPQNGHRPVSKSFDVLRYPLHHAFWAEDPSRPNNSSPVNSRSSIEREEIPVIDDLESSSSESLEEAEEAAKPKGPRYKEIKSFISLLCSTLRLKEEKADEEADASDDDTSSASHKVLSSSASDTPLFVKRPLPTSLQHGPAKSFTDFRRITTDSYDELLYNRNNSYGHNGTSGRLFERITALRQDCINGIGQSKLAEALRLTDNFEPEEFDTKLIELLGSEDYANYAGKIWQLKFCLQNASVGQR